MHRLLWALSLSALAGCAAKPVETDEHKLTRLRSEASAACVPVAAAESVLAAKYPMIGWKDTPIEGMSLAELKAHVAKLKREQARDSAIAKHAAEHPEEVQAEVAAIAKLQTKCDLAQRSLSIFMSGGQPQEPK